MSSVHRSFSFRWRCSHLDPTSSNHHLAPSPPHRPPWHPCCKPSLTFAVAVDNHHRLLESFLFRFSPKIQEWQWCKSHSNEDTRAEIRINRIQRIDNSHHFRDGRLEIFCPWFLHEFDPLTKKSSQQSINFSTKWDQMNDLADMKQHSAHQRKFSSPVLVPYYYSTTR